MTEADVQKMLTENIAREAKFSSKYDPISGIGSPLPRRRIDIEELGTWYLIEPMFDDVVIQALAKFKSIRALLTEIEGEASEARINQFIEELVNRRLDEDFEFWAYMTVKIKDKESSEMIPFLLRYPQRKLLKVLECEFRWKKRPIRMNIVKARQWGGSTEIQIYYNWIQVRRKKNWNSAIAADNDTQAMNIRGMFSRLAEEYPKELGGPLLLRPFEGSTKIRRIKSRGGIIGVGSMNKPEALRSFDFAMLHESEVGLWKKTAGKEPKDLVQTLESSVPDVPESAIIRESTAKGTGNFFYYEYRASKSGSSGFHPFFVGFWEIEMYRLPIRDVRAFIYSMSKWDEEKREYAEWLWSIGASLQAIKWYFWYKADRNLDDWRMKSEFPATAEEAFQSTGSRVFHPGDVLRMRTQWTCKPKFKGNVFGDADTGPDSLKNIRFASTPEGKFWVWYLPDKTVNTRNRYCVSVDIGGTTDKADFSVITVVDRMPILDGGVPECIATWRGHIDQDQLAWVAARIAKMYDNALLVVEANSLEKKKNEGDHFLTILNEIVEHYENIYTRTSIDKIREGAPVQWGFHTNAQTKPMIIAHHKKLFREDGYVEYDDRALVEADQYEIKEDGSYGASDGEHDDIEMSRAINLWIVMNKMEPVTIIKDQKQNKPTKRVVGTGESSF